MEQAYHISSCHIVAVLEFATRKGIQLKREWHLPLSVSCYGSRVEDWQEQHGVAPASPASKLFVRQP